MVTADKKDAFAFAKSIAEDIAEMNPNVLSIYGMGSVAEGRIANARDIDFTIIIGSGAYCDLKVIHERLEEVAQRRNIKIDTNFITSAEIDNGLINSDLFIHSKRHAFLIYELCYYEFLVYGSDTLKTAVFQNHKMIPEAIKLLQTLGYRLRKLYFTGNQQELYRQAIKFFTYAAKFSLIAKGFRTYDDSQVERLFIKHFPQIKQSIIQDFFNVRCLGHVPEDAERYLQQSFDSIELLCKLALSRYLQLATSTHIICEADIKKYIETNLSSKFTFDESTKNDLIIIRRDVNLQNHLPPGHPIHILLADPSIDEHNISPAVDYVLHSKEDLYLIETARSEGAQYENLVRTVH
jgi:predicted nucleotidyltransferase